MTGSDPDVSYRFNSQATPRKGGSGSNVSQYADPKVDELLLKGQTTINHDERKAVYLELQELLREDLHILPLYQMARIEGYKKGLMGYKNNVNVLSNSWNAGTWYWAS
ncbi:hypothetical protein L1889_01780 [Paenalcaligenes niemegkensis]|uniref:hypothetical protein n=1 Tax=Paenalcaligenes niemegkensis TaxID=2895469 RepID=UPI001EE983D6|nr:hypothetical protein [Paenalcaligenes niemegkensis]MCQ9615609.1 hypothetical protein [Paenalcaligenes niemegkensis]